MFGSKGNESRAHCDNVERSKLDLGGVVERRGVYSKPPTMNNVHGSMCY